MFFKKFALALSVVALVVPAGLLVPTTAYSSPLVVINELLWMGSPASPDDEWIELRNLSPDPVSLGGWRLTRLSSGNEVTMLTIPAGKNVEPYGYFLISNYALSPTSSHLAIAPDVVDTAVSLLNSGLQVKLYDASGALVDVSDDGIGTPLSGKYTSSLEYASMSRNGLPGDGTKKESWHAATTVFNMKASSPVLATPRAANDNVPPVVPAIPDQAVTIGQELTFDAADASDPDGDTLTFSWSFGDGAIAIEAAPTHVYEQAGTFTGSLQVGDGAAATVASFSVVVTAPPSPEPPFLPEPETTFIGMARINELLPNPEGVDDNEFIELSVSGGDADLSGWAVSDASGTTYTFPRGSISSDDSYPVIWRKDSRIALNNSGDTVTLKKPDGTATDEITFGGAEEAMAFAMIDGSWKWTTKITAGAANEFIRPNHAPVAKVSISKKREAGQEVTFDGSDSTDPDSDVLSYRWEFGDGATATGAVMKHVYEQAGTISGLLEASDGNLVGRTTFSITIIAQTTQPNQTAQQETHSGSVRLNEHFPNPKGSDDGEFIELALTGVTVDVSGWTLSDASSTTYTFPPNSRFGTGSFPVVWRKDSKIALNNDSDTVTLKKPNGEVADTVHFSDAEEGAAYGWFDGQWKWTAQPTPGTINTFKRLNRPPDAKFSISLRRRAGKPVEFDASDSTDGDGDALRYVWSFGDGSTGNGRTVKHVYEHDGDVMVRLTVRDTGGLEDTVDRELSIKSAVRAPKETSDGKTKAATTSKSKAVAAKNTSKTVTVEGWVTAAPGILGDGLFYLSNGTQSIAVRGSSGLPSLQLGDAVQATGRQRTKSGEHYILVDDRSQVVLGSDRRVLEPRTVGAGSIGKDDLGSLVTVAGEVTALSGSRFSVDDGTGEVAVYIRSSTGLKRPSMRSGDHVEVAGIVSSTSSGIRLLPRVKDDLRVISTVVQPQEKVVNVPQSKKPVWWMYVVVAGAVVVGAGVGMWRKLGIRKKE